MWQRLAVLLFLLLSVSLTQAATPNLVGGYGHTLYLSSDGTVSAWGWNEYGQLGNGTNGGRSTSPVVVMGLTNVVSVAAGYAHSVALKNDGTVWVWGSNDMGQLGIGTKNSTATQNSPTQVPNLSNIVAIAANPSGSHTVALKSDGSVYIWGANGNGQHCDSASYQSYRSSPYQISALNGATAVATSIAAIFVIKQGGVVACGGGGNSTGILGNGTTTQTLTPVTISSLSNITSLAGGQDHMLALKSDGTVWAWGENDKGQLGDGSTTTRSAPVQVSGLTGVAAIAAGARHSLVRKSDGSLASWGADASGQLGDNSVADRKTPYNVASTNVSAIGAGVSHSLALQTNGMLWAKGDNSNGQLGNGSLTPPTNSLPTASFNYILFPSSGTLPTTGGGVNIVLRDSSSDSDGSVVAWAWRVESSSGSVVCSSTSKDNDSCFVNTQGTYTIYLTVTDDRGATKDAAPQTVNISAAQNQTPQADFTMQAEGEGNLYLDGSASHDPDGSIYSYKWSISPSSGITMRENGSGIYQHAQFATPGTYTISLTVTDDKGATNTKQSTWQVSLSAPSPDFAFYPDGLSVKVDASNSKATSASIASYKWTASNGQNPTCDTQFLDCKVANFIFGQAGLVSITLLVTDTRGVTASISKDVTLTKTNIVPPSAVFSLTQTSSSAPYVISLDASASKGNSGANIISYQWTSSDRQTASGITASFSFSQPGKYDITLVTTDNRQQTATTTQSVTTGDPSTWEAFSITNGSYNSYDLTGAVVFSKDDEGHNGDVYVAASANGKVLFFDGINWVEYKNDMPYTSAYHGVLTNSDDILLGSYAKNIFAAVPSIKGKKIKVTSKLDLIKLGLENAEIFTGYKIEAAPVDSIKYKKVATLGPSNLHSSCKTAINLTLPPLNSRSSISVTFNSAEELYYKFSVPEDMHLIIESIQKGGGLEGWILDENCKELAHDSGFDKSVHDDDFNNVFLNVHLESGLLLSKTYYFKIRPQLWTPGNSSQVSIGRYDTKGTTGYAGIRG